MCTSFISRRGDGIIGMNFDNNGMKYNIRTDLPGQFAVWVDGGYGKCPSFGIRSGGTFANNMVVDSNGRGLYKRPSTRVTHTTKLVTDILNGTLPPETFGDYLRRMEIVNTPGWSCHNMICDPEGNVWVTEPGRGVIFSPANGCPFFVMSCFSLCDRDISRAEVQCSRYKAVTEALSGLNGIGVEEAFAVLNSARQRSGEWITELSMVYTKKENKVYYRIGEETAPICVFSFL